MGAGHPADMFTGATNVSSNVLLSHAGIQGIKDRPGFSLGDAITVPR